MLAELDTLEGKVIVDTSTPESLKVTMSNALVLSLIHISEPTRPY